MFSPRDAMARDAMALCFSLSFLMPPAFDRPHPIGRNLLANR
jgi:hypothetical protein